MPLKVIDTEWPNTVFLWLRAGVVAADQHVAWRNRPCPRRCELRFARTGINQVSIDA
jgi:hypothetical protein